VGPQYETCFESPFWRLQFWSPSLKTDQLIINIVIIIIIITESFYSLWSIGHPWRALKRCDLQLSPWPRSMIFLCFLFHPILSFTTFTSAYFFFYTSEDSNLMRFSLLLLLLYVMRVRDQLMLYRKIIAVLRTKQNTSIQYVGRIRNFLILKFVLYNASAGFWRINFLFSWKQGEEVLLIHNLGSGVSSIDWSVHNTGHMTSIKAACTLSGLMHVRININKRVTRGTLNVTFAYPCIMIRLLQKLATRCNCLG
jgi:hypothetical protein